MAHQTQTAIQPESGLHPWSPLVRITIGTGAASLLLSMITIERVPRAFRIGVAALAGGALLRTLTGKPASYLLDLATRPQFTLAKTLEIQAPAQDVFDFWKHFQNYPAFMSFVEDVSINERGGLHWKIKGPAGAGFQWEALVTALVPNRWIAWRSENHSILAQEGNVRLEEISSERTRLHVALSWSPPGGMLGSRLARALGYDPAAVFESDLGRMKALIEGAFSKARHSVAG